VTEANPYAVCGTLDAIEANFGIPIIYASQHRRLATEKAASWLLHKILFFSSCDTPKSAYVSEYETEGCVFTFNFSHVKLCPFGCLFGFCELLHDDDCLSNIIVKCSFSLI